jgi:hypothetical protein
MQFKTYLKSNQTIVSLDSPTIASDYPTEFFDHTALEGRDFFRRVFVGRGSLASPAGAKCAIDCSAQDLIPTLMYPLTLARHASHAYSAALLYAFLLSEQGQQLIAKEGRVVAHPKVDPIYPRMKELQGLLGTFSAVQSDFRLKSRI